MAQLLKASKYLPENKNDFVVRTHDGSLHIGHYNGENFVLDDLGSVDNEDIIEWLDETSPSFTLEDIASYTSELVDFLEMKWKGETTRTFEDWSSEYFMLNHNIKL